MKHVRDVRAWVNRCGDFTVDVKGGQLKAVVKSDGVSVRVVRQDEHEVVLASGRGEMNIDVYLDGPSKVVFVADHADVMTSVHVVGWGPVEIPAGWLQSESFTQLDLKKPSDVPAAVQEMMERMQKNSLRREAALRAEIEKLKK